MTLETWTIFSYKFYWIFALLTVKFNNSYTRWQPINMTKNIQRQVPH
jgi:hypothetical protein